RLAVRGLLAPRHDPQECRLPRPVRSEHADLRSVEERERDVGEHLPVGAVELVGPVHRVDEFRHRSGGYGVCQPQGYSGFMAVRAETMLDAEKLRADFPIFEQTFHGKPLAYLNSAATSQKPRQVLDTMTEFYETSYSNVHRGVYSLGEMATAGLERAREKVRAFVSAPSEREIIFVRNATEGLNLVAYAYGLARLKPGDVVLATQLEHHSNFVPWQYVAG